MTNLFDHVVIFAKDLGATSELWRKLGFQTSPRMYHEAKKGSMNELIMLQGNYIELLGTARLTDTTRYYTDLAQNLDGPFMQALRTVDVDKEVSRINESEFHAETSDHVFERAVPLPDGSSGKVRYRAWHSPYPAAPGLAVFGCHHLAPENLWIPEWQEHPNSAERVAALTFIDDNPERHQNYVESVLGARITGHHREGFVCELGDGPQGVILEYLSPKSFFDSMEMNSDKTHCRTGYCNCMTIQIRSVDRLVDMLEAAEIIHHMCGDSVIVRLGENQEMFLRFSAARSFHYGKKASGT
ncbi:MAG: VOC family protein [Gammaproteobacteria bacterium]